ncbi:hypothetical protein [Citrobacter freundii]|uniref:hypothetical protein n=1 Tax=Citrobacter freundii TaxID=546 RepID=UPI003B66C560
MTSKQALGLTMNELAEVNAEHVTTISKLEQKLTDMAVQLANSESKCRELAADNAGLKATCDDRLTFIMNGVQLGYIKVPTVESDPALETIRVAVSPQEPTPATDAFLAEVRAQGVEMFAAHKRERQQALRSRSMRMSEEAAGMAADAENFADELRKGVQS